MIENPHILPETAQVIAMVEAERARVERTGDLSKDPDLGEVYTAHIPGFKDSLFSLVAFAMLGYALADELVVRPFREKFFKH